MRPMKHIVFEYRDKWCRDGKFHRQECYMTSVAECIKYYGLEFCEYRIISVESIE